MTTREESIVWESCLLHKAAQLRNTVLTVKLPPQNFENGNEMIVGKSLGRSSLGGLGIQSNASSGCVVGALSVFSQLKCSIFGNAIMPIDPRNPNRFVCWADQRLGHCACGAEETGGACVLAGCLQGSWMHTDSP